MLFIKLVGESFIFAIQSIVVNKTRTILTLLGITIGIFCIIAIFTVFDSIERNIRTSLESLGSNVVFVQKWPWGMGGGEYQWWRYMRRPEPKLHELDELNRRGQTIEAAAFFVQRPREVSHQASTIEGAMVTAISHEYIRVIPFEIADGRYFTPIESAAGRNVAIIGDGIRSNLFGTLEPVGRQISVWGRKLEVIGTIRKEGQGLFGNTDNEILVPVNFARNFIDLNSNNAGTSIVVRTKANVSNEEMIDEVTGIMRSVRRLKPSAEDNFSINEASLLTQAFNNIFRVVSIVGWIIGGFSLLVGGFGIANIMFVSVKERTGIIGIQKSVGAKNFMVLFQFLFEAIFLSVFGGIIGLMIIFAGTIILSSVLDMELVLTTGNIFLGIFVSALIGLVSGFIPAWSASRLDPVEAMRTAI